jgi:glycosyltransferase involved in cell wall biosynthesis
MRYAWDLTWTYFNPVNFSWWKRMVIPFFLTYLRIWDITSNNRYEKLIAISEYVNKRVLKYYKRAADKVIYPPVYIDLFDNSKEKEDYYVSIAPFEPNKRGDLVVDVAIKLGIKVKILGKGSTLKKLQERAKGYDNVEFLGFVSESEKVNLLEKAKGLFFVGLEDFGIVPVEAIACGTPVIAYGDGGAMTTVIDGKTGVHFYEQSVEAISEAVERCEKIRMQGAFDRKVMRAHAEKFSKERFVKEIHEFAENSWKEFQNN